MAGKNKWFTVLAVFVVLLLATGIGAFKPKESTAGTVLGSSEKKIKRLGGIRTRMPENSALVFFKSTLGQDITSYKASSNMDEALFLLKTGETDAIWACDVTADYLIKTDDSLIKADASNMSDIQKTEDARFSFGMALKKDKGEALTEKIDKALFDMKEDGTLDRLVEAYVKNAPYYETEEGKKKRFYPDKMKDVKGGSTITVGITGAVPPLELIDENAEPYGFCVALMEELSVRLGSKIRFTVLDNETAFTSLMSEKVDMLFAYGTGRITTEYKQNYILTDGYLEMQRYDLITLK